eukprot:g8188.t1
MWVHMVPVAIERIRSTSRSTPTRGMRARSGMGAGSHPLTVILVIEDQLDIWPEDVDQTTFFTLLHMERRTSGSAHAARTTTNLRTRNVKCVEVGGLAVLHRVGFNRLIIEKPFGHDLSSAKSLAKDLGALYEEKHLLRMDHFLGYEICQNILSVRFGNAFLEPLMNNQHVAAVRITLKEDFGTEGRAPHMGGAAPRPSGRRKALLIGVNYFGTRAELRGCINDVHNLYRLLTETYGWPGHCIKTLTDDGRGNGGMPTRQNIGQHMSWLSDGDVLFFSFSGHGAQKEDPHGYEEDELHT